MSEKLVDLMASMTCLILGALYMYRGLIKLVPFPAVAYHAQVHGFKDLATVFPTQPLGIVPNADYYRVTVGILEILLGVGMLLPSNAARRLCAVGLFVITFTAGAGLVVLRQYIAAVIPLVLCVGLLWVYSTEGKQKSKQD